MSDVAGVILWTGVVFYAVFGGADFGAGFWDLTAGGAERGRRPRALIDAAVGPVWEANHVWLIFCLVVLWTAFPSAFAAIMTTLALPLTIAAFGIVVRGAGFAFLRVSTRLSRQRVFGAAFATSSVITPFFLGTVAGGVASGRVPVGGNGDPLDSWVNPTSILGGVFAVAVCAYLAAVFLVYEADRRGDEQLVGALRARAIGAAVAAGTVSIAGLFVLADDAPRLHDRLLGAALPVVVVSVLLGLVAIALLLRVAAGYARVAAAAAVAAVIASWGIAQYPNILGTRLPLDRAAAPGTTLAWVLGTFVVAAVLIGPSLVWLYLLAQRGELSELDT
ncbi:MAG TPA: cytochrome d ubiquinol oxidase subunit II [Acidimicrobiia bacterium]|nr:cytochrome d ubiquinol oxidase subunit II [Acidimicrobiia bacterium]